MKMTWNEFTQEVLGWGQFPDSKENPPLTSETLFYCEGNQYMITQIGERYLIVSQPEFKTIVESHSYPQLLEKPFIEGKSFHELFSHIQLV